MRPQRGLESFADAVCCLVPLVYAVPVFGAVAVTIQRLLTTPNVWLAYGSAINVDAAAMYLGQWPYRDPATGFFAQGYTPLFPAVLSVLHHIHYWRGWGTIVTVISTLALVAFAASLAYRRGPRARWLYVVEAVGIGALAWSIMDVFDLLNLYGARVDQFAWALAFGGLLLLPRALDGSRRVTFGMVALLSLGFWAKQTTLVVPAAVVGAALIMAVAGRVRWRAVILVTAAGAIANGLAFGLLDLATDGWQLRYNFTGQFPAVFGLGHGTSVFLTHTAVVLGFIAALLAIAVWGGWRIGLAWREVDPLVAALILAALLGTASGIWLGRYIGASENDYLGGLWAIGLLAAVAYRTARSSGRAGPDGAVAAATLALALTPLIGGAWTLRDGQMAPAQEWFSVPADVVAYGKQHVIYDPLEPDLNVPAHRVVFPHQIHIVELLERGDQPRWFVKQLLDRRIDAIYGFFGYGFDTEIKLSKAAEDNYFWKLNRVIEAGYVKSHVPPPEPAGPTFGNGPQPLFPLVPRVGVGPAPWIGTCFGPFELAGVGFEIGSGGGLWCSQPGSDVVRMRRSPAVTTTLESQRSLRALRGTLQVTISPQPGQRWTVALERAWQLHASVRGDLSGIDLALASNGGGTTRAFIPRAALRRTKGAVTLAFRVGAAPGLPARGRPLVVTLPSVPRHPGRLQLQASGEADVSFSLRSFAAAR